MTFNFFDSLSFEFDDTIIPIISGKTPFHFARTEYLVVKNENEKRAFKFQFEYHSSSFKQAAIVENLLLVGHESHFYIYDLSRQQNIHSLKMSSYFGHFYLHEKHIYVADAESLFCMNTNGEVIWKSENLGIDGVIISNFEQDKIVGSGEWDPPGGWRDFTLDLKTGYQIHNA